MSTASFATFGGFRLLEPASVMKAARRNGTTTEFWQRVNSFRCPRGREPGVGYLLMRGKDLSRTVNDASESANRKKINGQLNLNTSQELKWYTDTSGTPALTIPKLYVTRALRMTRRPREDDEDGAYLVEVMDKRRLLAMCVGPTSSSPADGEAVINVHNNYSAPNFNRSWQQAITTYWEMLPSSLRGTTPTLPYTPVGYPEELVHTSEPYWDFIHDLLEKIACTTVYDPIADTFRIVLIGDTQSGLDDSLDRYAKRLIFDYDPISPENTNLPYGWNAFFPVRHAYQQFNNSNFAGVRKVSKLRTGGSSASTVGTSVPVNDLTRAFVKVYSGGASHALSNGIGNSTNISTRAADILARVETAAASLNDRMRRHYGGIITDILPGEQITEVAWRDYGDGSGAQTEILRTPLTETKPAGEQVCSPFRGPDNSPHREWTPNPIAIVTVSGEPDENGLCSGGVVNIDPDNITSYQSFPDIFPIWVRLPNRDADPGGPLWGPILAGGPVVAKFIGYYNPDPGGEDSDERPLYVVADFPRAFLGKVINAGLGTVEIYQINRNTGELTTTNITLHDITGLNGDLGSTLHYSDGDVVVVQNVYTNRWFVTNVLSETKAVGTLDDDATPWPGTGPRTVGVSVGGNTIEADLEFITDTVASGTTVILERIAGTWYIVKPTEGPQIAIGELQEAADPNEPGPEVLITRPASLASTLVSVNHSAVQETIPSGTDVIIHRIDGSWYLVSPTSPAP